MQDWMLRSVEENRDCRSALSPLGHPRMLDTQERENRRAMGKEWTFQQWLWKNSYPYWKIQKLDFYLKTKIGFRWRVLERW